MRNFYGPLLAIAAVAAAAVFAYDSLHRSADVKTEDVQAQQSIAGVWRARDGGLPAVTLNITYETGSLNGAILFYLLRQEPGKERTATPGIPEPLIDPKFDGVTLTFAVSHRRAHPPATLSDPPAKFRLRITAPGRGQLVNELQADVRPEIVRDSD